MLIGPETTRIFNSIASADGRGVYCDWPSREEVCYDMVDPNDLNDTSVNEWNEREAGGWQKKCEMKFLRTETDSRQMTHIMSTATFLSHHKHKNSSNSRWMACRLKRTHSLLIPCCTHC